MIPEILMVCVWVIPSSRRWDGGPVVKYSPWTHVNVIGIRRYVKDGRDSGPTPPIISLGMWTQTERVRNLTLVKATMFLGWTPEERKGLRYISDSRDSG